MENKINKKKIMWLIFVCTLLIILVIFIFTIYEKNHEDISFPETNIVDVQKSSINMSKVNTTVKILKKPQLAPIIPRENDLSTNEIFLMAEKQGASFCDQLEDEYLREPCFKQFVLTKAAKENDASICNQVDDPDFVRSCQAVVITVEVAKTYYNESNINGEVNITPSNIDLCSQIENEHDRSLCFNPKKVIEKNYYQVRYELK